MSYRTFVFIFVVVLAASLPVFPQPQQKPPAPAAPPEEPPSVYSVPKDYHYNARGRRDPFVNPIPKPVQKTAAPPPVTIRPPGLKGVLVNEAQVIGIVASREASMNVVTLQAPGGKRYFARIGDALYDAVIKSIKTDSVTFAVTNPGTEERTNREIVRKMRSGENK